MLFYNKIVIGIILGLIGKETTSLKLDRVIIPAYKFHGEMALLECLYELNNNNNNNNNNNHNSRVYNETNDNRKYQNNFYYDDDYSEQELLYSVKWYKDNEEFYRFVPKAHPPQHSYKVDGIRVDHSQSDSKRVMLKPVMLKTAGLFRCEVSAEGPSFASVQGESRMDIIYLPKAGPLIQGANSVYQIGETLILNCSSGKSYPASKLQWFINNEQIVDSNMLMLYPDLHNNVGLIKSTLGLVVTVDSKHFQKGTMHLKCVASVSPVLWRGGKESIVQWRAPSIDNREAMLYVHSTASGMSLNGLVGLLIILWKLQSLWWM